jgi:hypothetical protein
LAGILLHLEIDGAREKIDGFDSFHDDFREFFRQLADLEKRWIVRTDTTTGLAHEWNSFCLSFHGDIVEVASSFCSFFEPVLIPLGYKLV